MSKKSMILINNGGYSYWHYQQLWPSLSLYCIPHTSDYPCSNCFASHSYVLQGRRKYFISWGTYFLCDKCHRLAIMGELQIDSEPPSEPPKWCSDTSPQPNHPYIALQKPPLAFGESVSGGFLFLGIGFELVKSCFFGFTISSLADILTREVPIGFSAVDLIGPLRLVSRGFTGPSILETEYRGAFFFHPSHATYKKEKTPSTQAEKPAFVLWNLQNLTFWHLLIILGVIKIALPSRRPGLNGISQAGTPVLLHPHNPYDIRAVSWTKRTYLARSLSRSPMSSPKLSCHLPNNLFRSLKSPILSNILTAFLFSIIYWYHYIWLNAI